MIDVGGAGRSPGIPAVECHPTLESADLGPKAKSTRGPTFGFGFAPKCEPATGQKPVAGLFAGGDLVRRADLALWLRSRARVGECPECS